MLSVNKIDKKIVIIYSESLSSNLLYRHFINEYPELIQCIIQLPYIPRKQKKTALINEPIVKKLLDKPSKRFLFFMVIVVPFFNLLAGIFRNRISDLAKRKQISFKKLPFLHENMINEIKKMQPDWIFNNSTCILKEEVLSIPKFGVINYHGGKLPQYRNVACMVWMMYNQEKYVNGTLHYVVKNIDAGDIILNGDKYFITSKDSILNVWLQIALSGKDCLNKVVSCIQNRTLIPSFKQDESKAVEYSFPDARVMSTLAKRGHSLFKFNDIYKLFNIAAHRMQKGFNLIKEQNS